MRDEALRDDYALGRLLGGDEGRARQQSALDGLRALGIVNPLADLRSYYPELISSAH